MNTSGSEIANNTITENLGGVYGYSSYNNIISENDITGNKNGADEWLNQAIGLHLSFSSNNRISGNNVTNNVDGIYLQDSSNNKIYHNNFINNWQQVYSHASTNTWDDGYPSGGNYWSDYAGIDDKRGPNQDQLGSDGIGDTPYIIDELNQDNYPLMKEPVPIYFDDAYLGDYVDNDGDDYYGSVTAYWDADVGAYYEIELMLAPPPRRLECLLYFGVIIAKT